MHSFMQSCSAKSQVPVHLSTSSKQGFVAIRAAALQRISQGVAGVAGGVPLPPNAIATLELTERLHAVAHKSRVTTRRINEPL